MVYRSLKSCQNKNIIKNAGCVPICSEFVFTELDFLHSSSDVYMDILIF